LGTPECKFKGISCDEFVKFILGYLIISARGAKDDYPSNSTFSSPSQPHLAVWPGFFNVHSRHAGHGTFGHGAELSQQTNPFNLPLYTRRRG
jgi:hypothetical protein